MTKETFLKGIEWSEVEMQIFNYSLITITQNGAKLEQSSITIIFNLDPIENNQIMYIIDVTDGFIL